MAIQVPVDVNVSGLSALEVLDEALDDVADPRVGDVELNTTPALAAAAALDEALDEATETRQADVSVDVNGLSQVVALDAALEAIDRHVEVEVDVDTGNAFRGATRAAQQSGGAISEAFSGAFQIVAKNAILLTAVVAAAFAALPVIGAVAATGLVLAFGSGIAGIGILAAAQSEKVKAAFGTMADGIVRDMKRIAAPLEDTLVGIAGRISETFDTFSPALEKAFSDLDPVLTRFSDNFFSAFENLEPAIAPLTRAFSDLLDSIGPRLDGFFTNLNDSFTRLSDVISADPELFSALFVGLLNVIPLAIDLVTDLALAFQVISETVSTQLGPAFSSFKDSMEPLSSAFEDATGGISLFRFGLSVTVAAVTVFVGALAAGLRIATTTARALRAAGNAIAATWRNTRIVTTNAWNAVRAAVSRGVQAVRSVISSGMAAARAVVSSVMARIRGAFSSAWAAIRGVVSAGVGRVRGAISTLSGIVGIVSGVWSRVRSAFSRGISSAVSLVRGLPGRVAGAMGNLGSVLYSSGVSLIQGFARGIRAAIGDAVSAASSAVSAVRDFFPFSPAKKGPFSGSGYTTHSGEALVKDWADAIDKTAAQVTPDIAAALDPTANAFAVPTAASPAPSGTTAGTAGGFNMDALVAALAMMFARLQLQVTLGRDRRTTAEWWLDGQRLAGDLT